MALHERYIRAGDSGKVEGESVFASMAQLAHMTAGAVAKEWEGLVAIDDELVAYIDTLRDNNKVALCSNAWESFIRPILVSHDLERRFDAIVVSSEVGSTKPDPRIYLHTAHLLGAEPEACVFIDDGHANVAGAERVGMRGIRYQSLAQLQAALSTL
jgi:putative hydrolase of the HAD superfamily